MLNMPKSASATICIVSEVWRIIGPIFAVVRGMPLFNVLIRELLNIAKFGLKKLGTYRTSLYRIAQSVRDCDILNRLSVTHECDRPTDDSKDRASQPSLRRARQKLNCKSSRLMSM